MAPADKIAQQLAAFEITGIDEDETRNAHLLSLVRKLPQKLRPIAMAVLGHDASGRAIRHYDYEENQSAHDQVSKDQQKFEKLTAAERKKIFGCWAPKIANEIEAAWQHLKGEPYSIWYTKSMFRAPKSPQLTLASRLAWLENFGTLMIRFQSDVISAPWLARWAGHAFSYRSDAAVPVLVAAINRKSQAGNEAFEILQAIVLREDPIGTMGTHVIGALLQSDRPEGWELMEKTLLAAQRQEGLRQVIVSEIPSAHREAFVRILQLIVDKDMIRFSSVARSVNAWFGLLWDSVSTKVLSQYVTETLEFIRSPARCKEALRSDQPETVYRALWATASGDAEIATATAVKLLKHDADEIRFVAVWMLTLIGTPGAQKAKEVALSDSNLQVALMAAVDLTGISVSNEEFSLCSSSAANEKGAFERLEELYQRLPAKQQKLPAIVWPWTERRIERSMLGGRLLHALDSRSPTRMLPYLKGLGTYEQRMVITELARQKKWDTLTRQTLFELCGHASADVRGAAFTALEKQVLRDDERQMIEGFLKRKASDIRSKSIDMLLKGKDAPVLESSQRLTAGNRDQRMAGLEILRRMVGEQRSADKCREVAKDFVAKTKKRSKEEDLQVAAILEGQESAITLFDAAGLMNPERRSSVVKPQVKKTLLISKAALACVKAVDDLVHQHRQTIITRKDWQGVQQQQPLGEAYYLDHLDLKKPLKPQLDKFPLVDVWQTWFRKRPAAQKDKDSLELVRALMFLNASNSYRYDLKKQLKNPEGKKLAAQVFGELGPVKLRYENLTESVLNMLLLSNLPRGLFDYLLDCVENNYARVTPAMNEKLLEKRESKRTARYHYWGDEDGEHDWRYNGLFQEWMDFFESLLGRTHTKLTNAQSKRLWQLKRYFDQPCPDAPRHRLGIVETCAACQSGWATIDDLTDSLLGADNAQGTRTDFSQLRDITSRNPSKEIQQALSQTKGLSEIAARTTERILEIELARGETPTITTLAALSIERLAGIDTLFRVLAVLNGDKFKVPRSWYDNNRTGRAATFTHLIRVTYPSADDTNAEFAKRIKAAIKQGWLTEDRVLELAFLAPQWTKFVEAYLNWDGFSEGLYWFVAHMNTWGTDAETAAAAAEGVVDDDNAEADAEDQWDDSDDDDDDVDGGSKDSIAKQPRLSAWERLVLERTPLSAMERSEGAVDVAWFNRAWSVLGAKRWGRIAEAAKFAANAAQARKAQFLANVLLGKTKLTELIEGIEKRKLKDYVRMVGLLPLAKGSKRDADLQRRYETLQAYKKYARTLSGLTKPAAMRSLEIGFDNLARLAGYPDPLRLEWALEAASIRDLAKGPIALTKEGVSVELSIDADGKPQLSVRRGDKSLKSIPAAIKKKHPAIGELADRATELRKKSSRIKQSLESAMCRGDTFSGAELFQLFDHAMLVPHLSRLVLVGEGIMGYPEKGGRVLRDYQGKLEPVKKNETLRLAHPTDLLASKKWDRWQHDCFTSERVQPFKQIFREVYVATKQELKDGTVSNRFQGHQISPRQAMALWNARAWNTRDEVFKMFHDLSLLAEVSFQYDYGTAAEIEGLTIETVQFRKRDQWKPMKLKDVPPRVFSEVMRDMDLVVSVAHRGEVDPESSASTVEMRSALLRETLQLLGLKNVKLKQNHALINGYYGEYSLHLGSGNIQRLPGAALAILPVHAQHRGRIFLPFADDDPKTAEIMSKALLLARDKEIMDPMILDQLGAPTERRMSIGDGASDTAATSRDAGKSKRKSKSANAKDTAGAADALKRYFEFSEGKSNKFWEIQRDGKQITTTWGRIGAKGQSTTKSYASESAAVKEFEKQVNAKIGKGYLES